MKISYQWLKEYVKIDVTPEELAGGLTMSGSEVEAIEDTGGDKVMSLEITSNRPDCLNIAGLAREASAVFDKDLALPETGLAGKTGKGPDVECVIRNNKLCPRYTARVITGVSVKEAGEKIRKRILAVGLRPVNNVVDVTNFCLMELGQPLHAFDLDKLEGGKVVIREAVKGEKIVTIDGEERELDPGMLVIADSVRPVAIAGVMGGKDTEVGEATRNILLESAYFDPVSVRRTARALGLSSDSSYRFERGVDKEMVLPASDRAAALIVAEAGGEICELYDEGKAVAEEVSVTFDTERAGKILGISLEKKKAEQVFSRLGMSVSGGKGTSLKVGVPSFREDIRKEIDLIEEVARVLGYDKIPETVPRFVARVTRKEHCREVDEKLRAILSAQGLSEIMTYSLISEQAAGRFPELVKSPIELSNPLSEEQKIMTPQILDGMLRAISWNINRKNRDLALFEVGKIYSRSAGAKGKAEQGKIFRETPALCAGLTGLLRKNWQEGERAAGLYDLKGIIETVLRGLKLSVSFVPSAVRGIEDCAGILLADGEMNIGFLGKAGAKVLEEYDIEPDVYICQLDLGKVMDTADLENRYHAVPRFPFSSRDISVLCEQFLPAGEVRRVISETGEEIIRAIDLVDVYVGKQIPKGKKSLTYSIKYGLDTRTLTDEEIEAVHAKVKETLEKELKVSFR